MQKCIIKLRQFKLEKRLKWKYKIILIDYCRFKSFIISHKIRLYTYLNISQDSSIFHLFHLFSYLIKSSHSHAEDESASKCVMCYRCRHVTLLPLHLPSSLVLSLSYTAAIQCTEEMFTTVPCSHFPFQLTQQFAKNRQWHFIENVLSKKVEQLGALIFLFLLEFFHLQRCTKRFCTQKYSFFLSFIPFFFLPWLVCFF